MPFAALLAALAEVPDPRRAQGQRCSMRHLLLFSVLRANSVQNISLALYANAVSFDQLLALGTQ